MKKSILVLIVVAMLIVPLAACGSKTAAVGTALVTVSGKIQNKNSGDTYVLDQAAFDANSVEKPYSDPWMKDVKTYKGILLSEFITLVNPTSDATTISLIATDGKSLDIPIADAQKYDIMLSRWSDGTTALDTSTGGPVKVAFPDAAKTTYTDDQWMWWIVKIDVK
ncbi:MAG: hypothetical protein ABSA51_11435 [Anaerolineaceae bacterium]|jgi:hypothetical protein